MYGGTPRRGARGEAPSPDVSGLSPRVRGNPRRAWRRYMDRRSIPACTGEPHRAGTGRRCTRVYPRVYGGTILRLRQPPSREGLSPRVRGNPTPAPPPKSGPMVYPRVYGGTSLGDVRNDDDGGLSPRVRGNRPEVRRQKNRGGSIPACTGEPGRSPTSSCAMRVYPRVYGGTALTGLLAGTRYGLSPRVRGNPRDAPRDALLVRGLSPRVRGNPFIGTMY